jgi:hypothetical protein
VRLAAPPDIGLERAFGHRCPGIGRATDGALVCESKEQYNGGNGERQGGRSNGGAVWSV